VKYLATPENINTKGWLGWAPLHKAAQLGHLEIVNYLLSDKLNAMVDIRDLENHTPLMLAAGTNQETPGHVSVVKALIDKGADVNATDDCDYSSLQLAVLNSNYDIAKVLLEARCDVDHKNQDEFTALHTACTQANKKMIQLLVDHSADITIKDARGKTPIELAKKARINLVDEKLSERTDSEHATKEADNLVEEIQKCVGNSNTNV
jgi:ankyrin repeat protein